MKYGILNYLYTVKNSIFIIMKKIQLTEGDIRHLVMEAVGKVLTAEESLETRKAKMGTINGFMQVLNRNLDVLTSAVENKDVLQTRVAGELCLKQVKNVASWLETLLEV